MFEWPTFATGGLGRTVPAKINPDLSKTLLLRQEEVPAHTRCAGAHSPAIRVASVELNRGRACVPCFSSWYTGQQSSATDEVLALDVEWIHVGRRPMQLLPGEVSVLGALATDYHTYCCPGE